MNMDAWIDEAENRGREEGREEGREKGREEGKIEMVLRYIRKKKISIDAALDDLDVPVAERAQYTNRLQQLLN